MKNRRTLLKSFMGLGLTLPLLSFAKEKSKPETNFIHHVFFWLKNPNDKKEREKFETALKEMGTIESISLVHIGTPADTNRPIIDTSYHYSLLVGFKNKVDHDIYQEHPIHDKFRNEYSDMWTKVQIYDSVDI